MRKLNSEESTLSTKCHNMLVAAAAKGAVVVDDKAKLAGLSEGDLAAAAQAAQDRDLDGKWVFPLQNTTQQPVLASLEDRDLRARILEASMTRNEHGDENDTRSEEHTSELQSLMRISYAVFCLKKKKNIR